MFGHFTPFKMMQTFVKRTCLLIPVSGVLLVGVLCLCRPLRAEERVSTHALGPNMTQWRIDEPRVDQPWTEYPNIRFQPGDSVIVNAGGCVQTGGVGATWKRYVDPTGSDTDHLYHGLVWIPGAMPKPDRIANVIGHSLLIPQFANSAQLSLRLGYEDDDYSDNGYQSHDDGDNDQCKGVGNAFLTLTITHALPPFPTAEEIGPNTLNGTGDTYLSTAGRMIGLAGDTSVLYGASLNAGIWRSVANGPWLQLARSPGRVSCIATDPNDPAHVAVGEDDGFAVDPALNKAGVSESHDAGGTWSYVFDPISRSGCPSQAIRAVAFSLQSTLFIAPACGGIGRKGVTQSSFDFSYSPPNLGEVTAFAISANQVWARTADKLLVSRDDGLHWVIIERPIPCLKGGAGGTDDYSLAAFDFAAYVPCTGDPTPGGGNHYSNIAIYQVTTNNWTSQRVLLGSSGTGDGTGLGGRRFVKAFELNRPDLSLSVGQRLQLFYCNAQAVFQADGLNDDGTIKSWKPSVITPGSDELIHPVHSDIWDFHSAPDGRTEWLAGDGGVSERLGSGEWKTQVDSLHTHSCTGLTLLPTTPSGSSRLAYSTFDNDGWFRDETPLGQRGAQWQHDDLLGDADWCVGDAGNPRYALTWRWPWNAALIDFDNNVRLHHVTINNDRSYTGLLSIQVIQTPKDEGPLPLLDAVLLANLPLTDTNGQPVPGPLGQPSLNGGPVLIRNTQFSLSPELNQSKAVSWSLAVDSLPIGTLGFWVAGGHNSPIYYAYARETGGLALYKQVGSSGPWQRLNISGLLGDGTYGPAFINPYDGNHLLALTYTGVKVSTDGGLSFRDDTVLTALLTGSGTYPLTGHFWLDLGTPLSKGVGYGPVLSTLAHVSFMRDDPQQVVAASPFTGAFYAADGSTWQNLNSYLPQPESVISAVGIDREAIYLATIGRDVVRIVDYQHARFASYFRPLRESGQAPWIASLLDHHSLPVPSVSIHVTFATHGGVGVLDRVVQTDANGRVIVTPPPPKGWYAVNLDFAGNSTLAPSNTSFVYQQ
jgi:hypothetical protein